MGKKVVMTAVLAAMVLAGSAYAQTAAQLHGRWNLAEYTTSGMGTARPGDEAWTTNYFIVFNTDGTFIEQGFWTPLFVAFGTWALSGRTLTLTLDGEDGGVFSFVRTRTLTISGNTLTMEYSRPGWNYTARFARSAR